MGREVREKSSYKEHQELVKKAVLYAQKRLPDARFFERHVGMFYRRNGTPIKINRPGMSDLYVLLQSPCGLIHIEAEFKTGASRLSKVQKVWKEFIEGFGGHFLLIKEEKELYNQIAEIKNGLRKDRS